MYKHNVKKKNDKQIKVQYYFYYLSGYLIKVSHIMLISCITVHLLCHFSLYFFLYEMCRTKQVALPCKQ